MKIRTKLAIGFLVVVAMIAPVTFLSLRTHRQIREEFEALKGDVIPGAIAMADMERLATQAHHHLMEYMLHGREKDSELVQSFLDDLGKAALKHLRHETHIGPQEQHVAEELVAKTKTLSSAIAAIIDLKRQGIPADELSRKEEETVHPAVAALMKQARAHKAVHMQELTEAETAIHRAHVAGAWAVVLTTVCAAVIALVAAFLTSRSIVRPLRTLQEGARAVAGGDLSYRVDTARRDELGELGRAFDRMTEGLSRTLVVKSVLEDANAALVSEVAERERAQAALRESEEGLRITLASIGDGVIATDTDRRVTRLNKAAEELTGWTLEQAGGKPLGEVFVLVDEQTRAPLRNPLEEAIPTRRVVEMGNHALLISRDRTERPIADSAAPILDAAGRVAGGVLVFRDISQERLARKEKDRLLRDLAQRVKELNCLYGLSEIAQRPGASLEGILGETVRMLPAAFVHPESACARICYDGRTFETNDESWATPAARLAADVVAHGEKVGSVGLCYCQPAPDAGDSAFIDEEHALLKAVAEWLGKAIEHKQAEEQLRESEAKYRTLLEHLPQKIFSKDRNSVYVSCNENFARVVGITPEELVGKTDHDFFPKELAEKYRADDKRIMESGRTETIEEQFIDDGRELTVQTVKTPIVDATGNTVAILAIFWDITDRKRYEEHLAHLATQDPLTGLPNRATFEEVANRAIARARRGTPSALLVFDVDHFKLVNDTFGHARGDEVLVRMSQVVRERLRGEDILARLGGDEFAALLEGAPLSEAQAVAERMRRAAEDSSSACAPSACPTLSIGLIEIDGQQDLRTLLSRADAAMYQAKGKGRNRVVCLAATSDV